MLVRRLGAGAALALAMVVGSSGAALAHNCINTQRSGDGGVAGTIDAATGTFTPSGAPGNPTFVKVILPDGSVIYGFEHSGGAKNGYVVPGAKDCDGKGLDLASACFGG